MSTAAAPTLAEVLERATRRRSSLDALEREAARIRRGLEADVVELRRLGAPLSRCATVAGMTVPGVAKMLRRHGLR